MPSKLSLGRLGLFECGFCCSECFGQVGRRVCSVCPGCWGRGGKVKWGKEGGSSGGGHRACVLTTNEHSWASQQSCAGSAASVAAATTAAAHDEAAGGVIAVGGSSTVGVAVRSWGNSVLGGQGRAEDGLDLARRHGQHAVVAIVYEKGARARGSRRESNQRRRNRPLHEALSLLLFVHFGVTLIWVTSRQYGGQSTGMIIHSD